MNGGALSTSRRVCADLGLAECRWQFPSPELADPSGALVIGADLEPSTLITAYCSGVFPMPTGRRRRIGWWSPDPRAVLDPKALVVSRSLRRSCRRFEVRVDSDFRGTMSRCGDPRRPHGWINAQFLDAYCRLDDLGLAHSVECWNAAGELVGGLYGVSIGGFFAGESMFHLEPDASKVALVGLCTILAENDALLDVQWITPHLRSLGAVEIPRSEYLSRLEAAVARPPIDFSRDRPDPPS